MRDERPHELEEPPDRHPRDRDEPRPHQAVLAGLVDDEEAVREVVEPERVEVDLAAVPRVEREEAGVPVPDAGERRDAHEADEELVVAQARRAPGEPLDLGPEARAGDVPEESGVRRLERLAERPHVPGGARRRRRRGVRRGDDDHGEGPEEHACLPHHLG